MMCFLARIARNRRGATAAEFAMVLPVLIMFLFGVIDGGRWMWTLNRAEKATQLGARYAVVADVALADISSYNFALSGTTVPQGDPVPQSAFGGVSCTSTGNAVSCSCTGDWCTGSTMNGDSAAFNRIVTRMQAYLPEVTADKVRIDYDYSGLGFSGNPAGSDVSPIVRVSLREDSGHTVDFRPLMLFGTTGLALPSSTSAMTLEDGEGSVMAK